MYGCDPSLLTSHSLAVALFRGPNKSGTGTLACSQYPSQTGKQREPVPVLLAVLSVRVTTCQLFFIEIAAKCALLRSIRGWRAPSRDAVHSVDARR